MTAVALLARLRVLDVHLEADGDRLRLNAPPGVVDTELRAAIAACKAELLDLLGRARRPLLPPIEPMPRTGDLPLSFAQQRIWFLTRLEPDGYAYNEPATVRLEGELRQSLLGRSLAAVVERHEILRTTVMMRGGELRQVIADALTIEVPLVDLEALPASRRAVETQRVLRRRARQPFDLAHGPLLRAVLVRTEPQQHSFSVVLQHLICDGWSTGILARELAAIYGALVAGGPSPLPPLAIQYGDVAAWQRRWLTPPLLEADLAFWRRTLEGAPTTLELMTDRPRGTRLSRRGGRCRVAFDAEETRALGALASTRGATLFAVLMAGFQAVLARHAGQDDVVVGTSVANRSQLESEALIGFFVNTLVIRGDLAGDPGFGVFVERIHRAVTAAAAHQELPFEQLVEALRPVRENNRTPLFQTMFVLQNFPLALHLPGLVMHRLVTSAEAAKFDLTLDLTEISGAIEGAIEFNRDLFDEATVARLVEHLRCLLLAGAARPETRIWRLPMLASDERRQLLVDWSGSQREPAVEPADVASRIAAWAECSPSATAIVDGDQSLTYAALRLRAAGLAAALTAAGVGPETVVGICVERGALAVVAALAVLEAGGVCLPLDAADPASRLTSLARDAGMRCLVSDRAPGFDLPAAAVVLAAAQPERVAPPPPEWPAESLAYVIYTSGSTGAPKAVGVGRGALAEHLTAVLAAFDLRPCDRVLQIAATTFDVAFEQILATLAAGATLVLRGPQPWGPREVVAAVRRHGLTVVNLPTAVWQQWASTASGRAGDQDFPSLRLVIAGGDVMTASALADWRRGSAAGVALLNAYGPTEGVITATVHAVVEPPAGGQASVPIGRPLVGRTVRVVGRRGVLAPRGAAGELCLGGPILARGYLGRPGATAERFVPDPWCHRPGGRLYRTGDRVRFDAEGRLTMLGRLDQQVKVRGFRVEPGEIEALLARHESVAEAVVVVREDAGDKALIAFVVAAGELEPSTLAAELRSRLPAFLVPSRFIRLDALPLTAHGKVDRAALRRLAQQGESRDLASDEELPRGETEERLAAIWRELLEVTSVVRHDDFFDLGGHSLLGARLIARIEDSFGVDLPLTALFETPTLRALAARIAAAPVRLDRLPIGRSRAPGADGDALSSAQQRLWLLDQLDPGSTAYADTVGLELEGSLCADSLRRALDIVIARHDILHTVFFEIGGTPRQRVLPQMPVALATIDLTVLSAADRGARVAQCLAPGRQPPFDLARGPLVRFRLLQLAPSHHVLIANVHHIVGDAWSNAVLTEEVAVVYSDLVAGRAPSLPPPALQYADFAAWQRTSLDGPALDRLLDYWRRQLDGAPPVLDLPTDLQSTAPPSARGDLRRRRLGSSLTADLRRLARALGASLYMVVLAGFTVWLGQRSGRRDLVIGTTSANRDRVELERVAGFFVNMLVLRLDLRGDPSFAEIVGRVKPVVLGALEHQAMPFDRLVEALKAPRLAGRNPLFQVAFTYENAPVPPRRIGDLTLRPIAVDLDTSIFDLALIVEEKDAGLEASVRYLTDLFRPATIDALLEQIEAVLAAVAQDPSVRRSALGSRIADMESARRSARDRAVIESSLRARVRVRRGAKAR